MRRTYYDEYTDCEIAVNEQTLKEAIEYAKDFIDSINFATGHSDISVYVEYKDGKYYHNLDGDVTGKFKKTGIKGIIMDDGYDYFIYGRYKMSENMIPSIV